MTGRQRTGRPPTRKWSGLSEIAISVLVIGILGIGVISSLPKSTVKANIVPAVAPVAQAVGLEQNWAMFAPEPLRTNTRLEVHVIMSDGEDRVWRPEEESSMPRMYWRAVKERVSQRKEVQPGLAAWVIRQQVRPDERPARVVMVVITETIPLPGQGEPKVTKRVAFDKKLAPPARR
ncbi:hypothetical protein [Mycolicibacterium sp. XJ1819]